MKFTRRIGFHRAERGVIVQNGVCRAEQGLSCRSELIVQNGAYRAEDSSLCGTAFIARTRA